MAGRLEGKAAVVTGGSRGIGAGIAKRLAAEGADVVITYAGNQEAADTVVKAIGVAGRRGQAIQADAASSDAVRRAIEEAAGVLGGIDILVHNAGIGGFAPVTELTEELYRRQFGVNVDGVFTGTIAALPHLRDSGRILIVGSVSAFTSVGGDSVYGATKAAVTGLARGWARDLGARGILVNVIQPGPIDTDLNPADGEFAKMLLPRIPIGRYGRVEEVAALAAFLASDEAGFITGATFDIDGGLTI